jgi:2-polyprenyl-3-methyl-5-hydroxy-6-metoxy-1,4-benzoquinol methylase
MSFRKAYENMSMDRIERTKSFFNKRSKPTAERERASPVQEYVYKEICNAIPGTSRLEHALDVGCHWGRYTKWLALSYRKVWGVDYSELAVQSAQGAENIEYVCLDVDLEGERLCEVFPRMDLVTAVSVFEMVRRPDQLAANLYRVIRPGGKIFVVIPNRLSLNYFVIRLILWIGDSFFRKGWYIWNNRITPQRLKAYLQASGFEIDQEGMIVGVPVYLVDRLPHLTQSFFIGMDSIFKAVCRGGYYCISASKGRVGLDQ